MGNSSSGSILPWDDWLYHTGKLRAEVQDLHNQAISAQNDIQTKVPQYNTRLNLTKELMSGNAALVIIARAMKFTDLELKNFEVEVEALPDPPKGCIPAKWGMFLSQIGGCFLILKAVVNIGKLVKKGFFKENKETNGEINGEGDETGGDEGPIEEGGEAGEEGGEAGEVGGEEAAEGLAESSAELGVEAGVEVGAGAALAETGIGIIAAVGIDAIFGAINGAKEADELKKQIDKFTQAVYTLKKFLHDLDEKFVQLDRVILQEEKRYIGIESSMQAVIPYRGAQLWPQLRLGSLALPTCIAAQSSALRHFGLLATLRVTYIRCIERNPLMTRDQIISVVEKTAKTNVTRQDIEDLWVILEEYSVGMKNLPHGFSS